MHSLTALPQAYGLRFRRCSASQALLPGSRGHPKRSLLTLAGGPTRTAFAADGNGSTAAVRERAAAPAVTVAGVARIKSPRTARTSHHRASRLHRMRWHLFPSARDRPRGKP